jgi:hypothetical protein
VKRKKKDCFDEKGKRICRKQGFEYIDLTAVSDEVSAASDDKSDNSSTGESTCKQEKKVRS